MSRFVQGTFLQSLVPFPIMISNILFWKPCLMELIHYYVQVHVVEISLIWPSIKFVVFLFVAQKSKMSASAEHNFRTISIWENIVFFSETIKQYNIWIQTWFECSWYLMTLKKYIFVYIRNPRWSPLQDKVLRWNH